MSTFKGIDVSKWNGTIDWAKVKGAGYTFAMIRLGYCGYAGDIFMDTKFKDNMAGALAAGLDVGVYLYSYAKTAAAARAAAIHTLDLVKGYPLTYPIAFDIEDEVNIALSKETNTAIVDAYLSTIEEGGYYAVLYTFKAFTDSYLNMGQLAKYDFWVAQWASSCTYSGNYGMWQHSATGSVPGISGDVDLNIAYKDYPAIIQGAGLNGFGSTTNEEVPEPHDDCDRCSVLGAAILQIMEIVETATR